MFLHQYKGLDKDKLDAKDNKCIFVGYSLDDMGCRFWDN